MKKLIKNSKLLILLILFGTSVVVLSSFAPDEDVTVVWFELDQDGFVIGEKDPNAVCDDGSTYCAVSVNSTELNEDGMPLFDNVEESGASEHYIDIASKD